MMNIQQVFDLAVKKGIEADPRGVSGVKKYLDRVKRELADLKPDEKKYFDQERLSNPYADSRIHHANFKRPVKRVLAGIDIGPGEVLLASQLNERGKNIDLVIAHHPTGKSLAGLHSVMDMFVEVYEKIGMPVHLAEKLMEKRIAEVERSVHPINHYQVIDIAKALDINLMNTHTITDNMVKSFVRNYVEKQKPQTIADLLKELLDIPEYAEAKKLGAGPSIFAGSPKHRVGKFILEMTGGTNPSDEVYKQLSRYGISTIIGMHMKDTGREQADKFHMNVVIAGHIASDSLGMNLFLDELEKQGIEIVPCGGLIRVSRNGIRNTKNAKPRK